MEKVTGVLITVLPVLVMLFIGMLCRRFTLISKEGIKGMQSLVVNITLPAVLLGAFARTSYSLETALYTVAIFIICLAAYFLGYLAKGVFRAKSKLFPFFTTGFEAGMLGYAFFILLFGAINTNRFAVADLGQVLFVFTVYNLLLGAKNGQDVSFKQSFQKMLLSPIIIAIAVGVVLGATGLSQLLLSDLGQVLFSTIDFIAAPTGAVILIVVGYGIQLGQIRWVETLKTVGGRLLVLGILLFPALYLTDLLFPGVEIARYALILLFILPPPFVLSVFVANEDEEAYISSSLSVSTLLSVLLFAVMAWLVV